MLGLLEKSRAGGGLQVAKCLTSRFLSTKQERLELKDETCKRKYARRSHRQKPRIAGGSFLGTLFSGKLDRRLLYYPSVLKDDEVDSVLKHSVEIENVIQNNSESEITKDVLTGLQKAEAFGLSVPLEYGGAGYTHTESKFLLECIGINPRIGRFLSYNEDFGARLLNEYGSDELKQKYLPRIAAGESFISLAYIEKGPVVDISSFKGRAVRDDRNNGFIVNAQKKWVHHANISDLFLLLTNTALIEDRQINFHLDMFLVEKNTPGIRVQEINTKLGKEFGFYDVDFEKVFVPEKNVLGNEESSGFTILKSALLHNGLSDAVMVCSLLKKMLFHAVEYCDTKKINGRRLSEADYIINDIQWLSVYIYGLESMIYMVAGRLDSQEKCDLIFDSIATKILALDMLKLSVNKLTQIMGMDGFISPGILEEAIKTLHYYSVFEENIYHLKLYFASEALIQAGSFLARKVLELRNKHEYPAAAVVRYMRNLEERTEVYMKKHNLTICFEGSIWHESELLEAGVGKLELALEEFFIRYGSNGIKEEPLMIKFAEMATYIYALTASLGRATNSISYKLEKYKHDEKLMRLFSSIAYHRIDELFNEVAFQTFEYRKDKEIGELTFTKRMYPVDHPLARTY